EVQRIEHELWNLKVKEYNIAAYTQRFNELALMCPRMVEPENVKVDAYIRGLSENIKGEVTSSKPANLSEAMRMAHKLMEQKIQAKKERDIARNKRKEKSVATGANALPVWTCYDCVEQGHTRNHCPKKNKPQGGNASGRAYVIKDSDKQGPNVVMVNHLFEIDLMPIELGTFDVIIGMDWLAKRDAVIVCGEKAVPHVTEKKSKEKRLEDVSVIRDFPEVFPDDLP
ncbi:putative reverse transcriptase domain-containing protein, partial [Tanacetum coccineum]